MRTALASLTAAFILACVLIAIDRPHDARAQGKKPPAQTRCTIYSVTAVAFGSYDTDAGNDHTTTGRLDFSCTPPNQTITVQVTIGPSATSGSITERRMRELGGADELRYNLFQDQRGTIVWGDGVTGGSAAFFTGAKSFSVEIYGIARAKQQVSVGLYADSVRITILP